MARYKRIDTGLKLLLVDLSRQLLPGTFERALSHLLDHELDLRTLDERFRNDEAGEPAYAPSVLLKVILFAYSRGMVNSRDIAQACRENVVFMALSGDSAPHFTTLACFIRELKDEIANLFTQVLFLCDAQGLIGRGMFAIDGVKPRFSSKNGRHLQFRTCIIALLWVGRQHVRIAREQPFACSCFSTKRAYELFFFVTLRVLRASREPSYAPVGMCAACGAR